MPDEYKPISLKPINGTLDNRSMPEDTASGYVRKRENFQINSAGKMGRRQCWTKFLHKLSGYNNADLHDQMLAAQIYYDEAAPVAEGSEDVRDFPPGILCATIHKIRTQTREPITLLFQATSTSGGRYWIVGTQSRLYELNVATEAYRLLCDGLGGVTSSTLGVRFRVGQVKDTLVFTNNVDGPFSYTLGDEISGCAMRATREIPDLALIRLSSAVDVIGFKGHILLFNVVMDGGRLTHRYVWTDFMLGAGSLKELVPGSSTTDKNDPKSYRASVSFDPAITDTIAGYDELPFGHRILRAIEFNGRILVFTNHGIFAVDTTGAADKAFGYVRLYEHPDGAGCLFYPNTLINCGNCLRYMGRDGVYRWDSFTIEPEKEEWLHRGTGELYGNLNREACETHCAGFTSSNSDNGEEREVFFSYAEAGQDLPGRTLTVQPDQRFTSPLDHGFTAFGNCQPDARPSVNDFLRQYCVCTGSDLSQEYIKEGAPITDPVCAPPASICKAPSYGDNIASGNYDIEGMFTLEGLEIGKSYKLVFGASEIAGVGELQIGSPLTQTVTADGFFTADSGTAALVLTGSVVEQTLTSGLLIVGRNYHVDDLQAGDDFANVGKGGGPNFTATGTTPTNWTHGSELVLILAVTAEIQEATNIVCIDGACMEDFSDGECDDDSLCALLGGVKLDDICLSCESESIFVGASSKDYCLKQIGNAFSREVCLNAGVSAGALNGFSYTNARGVYVAEGYYSRLIIGPHPLKDIGVEKNVRNVMLELEVPAELRKNVVALRIGYSYSPLDPNKTDCGVVWGDYIRRELACPQELATAEYRKRNLRPHVGKEWPAFKQGRWLYFDFLLAGLRNQNDMKSDLVPALGAESYFSSVVVEARKA